jgi:DNA-binding NtrC family response regulator
MYGLMFCSGDKMANILIVDDQAWIKDLCREGLTGEGHNIFATDNIEAVTGNISSFEPHIVLLNQYLKHGFLAWDVLKKIKSRDPDLFVLIVTVHDTHLKCPQLSLADGYVVNSHTAGKELRQKISTLLGDPPHIADEP